MNIGALIVLVEALKNIETASGLIGPPAPNGNGPNGNGPNGNGETLKVKPNCGPGEYASFNTSTDKWTCEVIPKGR